MLAVGCPRPAARGRPASTPCSPPPHVPPQDGGALDLFDSDPKTGFPTAVAKSLAPRWNSLAFFTVTPGSFHQVAEVLSASKGSRLSISGWFHGKAPPRPTPLPLPAPRFSRPRPMTRRGPPKPKPSAKRRAKREEEDEEEEDEFVLDLEALGRWVHPRWLAHAVSGTQMSSHFASNGSIELVPFLREDAYAAALKAMRVQQWVAAGPPHVRQYRVAAACHCEGGGGPGAIPDEAPMAAAAPAAAMVEPLQVTEPETGGAAPGTTTSGYRRHNGTNGGPGDAWRSQSAAVPDAAVQLWQAMRSPAMAFLLHAITGAGTVQEWAVEARALGPGSYTLVSDPELRRHRHKSGGSPDSSGTSPTSDDDDGDEDGEEDGEEDGDGEETPGGKRPRGAPEEEAAAQPEGSDGAEDDKDDGAAADEEDAVRIEACLCLLDPFAGEAKPGVAWPESAGGYTVLLTADEELCTVEPRANALSVLGLPDGATSFVKYVTADAPGTRFDVVIRAKMG